MTDITPDHAGSPGPNRATEAVRQSLRRRNRKQTILQGIGLAAIGFALLMLFILIASLVGTGHHAFTQTHVEVEVYVDPEAVSRETRHRSPRQGRVPRNRGRQGRRRTGTLTG